jgi:exopolysaccharide production protein ExoZ
VIVAKKQNRIQGLDYLRGLAAFGIMVFHYSTWTLGKFEADTVVARIGIYGVSIFYAISGLTLFSVYHSKMQFTTHDLYDFFKKRILRIFPLLWLVFTIGIFLYNIQVSPVRIFLNYTGLFGIFSWDSSLAIGAWSIGNELVFYLFLPVFIFTSKKYKKMFIAIVLSIILITLYFTFFLLDVQKSLNEQSSLYTHPLNQIFLFLGGFLIGLYFKDKLVKPFMLYGIFFISLVLFVFYPVYGNEIALITGINRWLFAFCSFALTFCFYKVEIKWPEYVSKPLVILGEISYAMYLLHPVFYELSGKLMVWISLHYYTFPETVRLLLAIGSTLVGSYFIYNYFEKKFISYGHLKTIPK